MKGDSKHMYRVMNEYLAKVRLEIDVLFSQKMDLFLADQPEVVKYCINVNYNKYVVDVHMKQFSIEGADRLFCQLASAVTWPYSHMSLRYNEGSCVRYRFVTCNEEKRAVYMDVILS